MPIAQPRARRVKDRAGSTRMAMMPAKNIAPNWFGNQIKRRRAEPTLNLAPSSVRGRSGGEDEKQSRGSDELYGKAKITT
jgi:hypothetical protein